MAEISRNTTALKSPGPYKAVVVSHIDKSFMGTLKVQLIRALPGDPTMPATNAIVKYCSPFAGQTSINFEGNNSADFNSVQKAYGMWMVPPDIGSVVLVMFTEGDINQGYWIGCISDLYQNHMIPGIAASKYSAITPEQERYYGTKYLPVAEFHKKSRPHKDESTNQDVYTKPVHPFANRLLEQGLLIDTVRGVTSSGARRETPSQVFGISTPGPLDLKSPQYPIGDQSQRMPVSRLGGTTFVMDDGDKEGLNELVRLRTRTGHQILLHNSSDLIYIGNSKGTAWIELTSDGKIDIFAEDSVSIHTKNDFNFYADRDFNLEVGRNINIKVAEQIQIESGTDFNLLVGANGKVDIAEDFDLNTGGGNTFTAGGETNILSGGDHIETAPNIHMNGPQAAEAATVDPLPTFKLPNRDTSAGWSDGNFYKIDDIETIMKRVPTHEPWDHHENIDPDSFNKSSTDITS